MKRTLSVWAFCLGLLLAGSALAMCEDARVLTIPAGTVPVLDGMVSEGEWDDALMLALAEDTSVYVKHADGFLYLGVATQTGAQIVGNVYIADEDRVRILHASHALGPATYRLREGVWALENPFVWSCRTLGFSDTAIAEREDFLNANGWLATVVNLGQPEHMEYQIAIGDDAMRMLFRFDIHREDQRVLTWPLHTIIGIEPGPLPPEAAFRPEEWYDVVTDRSKT